MNKKLMGILIPVLGGIAIVGSGFSAWYFGCSGLRSSGHQW